jgi:apolipoprotein N-acyltransferase
MKIKFILVYFFILCLGAFLLFFSHPPKLHWGLIFVCLVPLIFFINKAKKNSTVFFGGSFYGFIYFFLILSWVLNIEIEQIEQQIAGFLILKWFFFILLVLVGSFCFGVWALILKKLEKKNSLNYIVLGSFAFILLEYFKAFFVSILFLGKESYLAAHWTFGNLGYGLVNYPLLSNFASIGGVYLLSFIVVFINLFLFSYLIKKVSKRELSYFVILLLFFILVLNFFTFENEFNITNVGVIQTSENERSATDYLNNIISNNLSESNIIILPENVGKKYFNNDKENMTYFEFIPENNQIIIFSKYIVNDEGSLRNTIYYLDGNNSRSTSYDKTFLMPFGEYTPYLLEVVYPKFTKMNTVNKGDIIKTVSFKENVIGALVCGAFMSPVLSSNLASDGNSEIIINLASNSVFGSDREYRELNLHYSRLRAIENNRYFVQAAHEGYSFVIDNSGKIIYLDNSFNSSYFDVDVALIEDKTFYSLLGNWILIFGIIYFILENYLNSKRSD